MHLHDNKSNQSTFTPTQLYWKLLSLFCRSLAKYYSHFPFSIDDKKIMDQKKD